MGQDQSIPKTIYLTVMLLFSLELEMARIDDVVLDLDVSVWHRNMGELFFSNRQENCTLLH